MEQICKNCANSEKVCGATMIVICGLTGFPECYDHDAEHCIGFEPKEENDAKIEEVINNSDIFYGEIHIATDHLEAWAKEYNNLPMKEMSLIEEMSELTQAISKYYRNIDFTKRDDCVDAIKEEMAHVLISLKGLAWGIGIRPEDIQAEIEKKWPSAYEPEKG